jgi:hypothetical protein
VVQLSVEHKRATVQRRVGRDIAPFFLWNASQSYAYFVCSSKRCDIFLAIALAVELIAVKVVKLPLEYGPQTKC